MVLIADPQLVDPHTYPGRPWPLSSLTIWSTDLYLRRSYRLLQNRLEPDTVFFLGDLFDGGREWATETSTSSEKQYKRYGDKFWLAEYRRFVDLYMGGWKLGYDSRAADSRGRRVISSLPGNHDLGFAGGIQQSIKDRFDAYFGPMNRVDIIGNHTFVSVDSVSLSAMDQVDPLTGSSGMGDGTASKTANSEIWRPVDDFLKANKQLRDQAISNEFMSLRGGDETTYYQNGSSKLIPSTDSLDSSPKIARKVSGVQGLSFPTILLTHVPLFRPPDTDCGPFRERGKGIPISKGYQYQNVLTPQISKDVIDSLNAVEVAQVYSGDDHDYCEIEHLEFTGRIPEITVKSISWAMGVRRPGFLAVSLYNPVDLDPITLTGLDEHSNVTPKDTIQNHLCLLPDQLGIFLRYLQLLVLTLLVLAMRALFYKPTPNTHLPSGKTQISLLPISRDDLPRPDSSTFYDDTELHIPALASSTSTSQPPSHLSTRSNGLVTTSISPYPRSASPSKLGGYGNLPPTSRSSSPAKHLDYHQSQQQQQSYDPFAPSLSPSNNKTHKVHHASEDWSTGPRRRKGVLTKWQIKRREFWRSLLHVGVPAALWFTWLVWNDG